MTQNFDSTVRWSMGLLNRVWVTDPVLTRILGDGQWSNIGTKPSSPWPKSQPIVLFFDSRCGASLSVSPKFCIFF
jgi:hypothetical protein